MSSAEWGAVCGTIGRAILLLDVGTGWQAASGGLLQESRKSS